MQVLLINEFGIDGCKVTRSIAVSSHHKNKTINLSTLHRFENNV